MDLERIRSGDTAALGALLADAWGPLVRYVATLADSADAAQDVAQEAFVRLWERRERWASGSARAVLFRIARNVALDQGRRREVRERWAREEAAAGRRGPPTPEEELTRSETAVRLRSAIAALPPRRREVFELVRFDGLSHAEVAEVIGVSAQTVANQMSLALRELRGLLAEPGRDRPPGDAGGDESRSSDG